MQSLSNAWKDLKKAGLFLAQQGGWVLVGRIYVMAASLGLSVVLARLLTEVDYGAYKFVIAIFSVCAVFSVPESFQLVIRYIPQGLGRSYAILQRLRWQYSIGGSVVLLGIAAFQYAQGNPSIAYVMIFCSVLFPAYYTYQLFEPVLQAKMQFKQLNKIYIIKATAQVISILLAYLLTDSVYVATVVMLATVALLNLALSKWVEMSNKEALSQGQIPIKQTRRQAIFLSLFAVPAIVAEQADKLIIGKFLSLELLAVYSIGITLGSAINAFFKPFMATISAKLVHRKLEGGHFLILFVVGTVFGAGASIFLPAAVRVLYGARYWQATDYASVVLLSMGLYFVHTIYYNQAVFYKKSSITRVYVNNLVVPIITLGAMIFTISFDVNNDLKLILLASVYPLKLLLSMMTLYIMGRR